MPCPPELQKISVRWAWIIVGWYKDSSCDSCTTSVDALEFYDVAREEDNSW